MRPTVADSLLKYGKNIEKLDINCKEKILNVKEWKNTQ